MAIKKKLELPRERYYEIHLAIINAILPVNMTPREVEVLAHFMALTGSIGEERFGTSARKIVKKNLGLSDGGLGNYLMSLREKGFIIGKTLNPLLECSPAIQEYEFKLINIDTATQNERDERNTQAD